MPMASPHLPSSLMLSIRVVRNWKIATVKLPNATRARRFLAKFSDYSQEIIIFELQLNACPQAPGHESPPPPDLMRCPETEDDNRVSR
mmetsp:Transcript_25971/g.58662  ORF Transcript_25971/g.58662 Transcript_25971/m.58662 type:complete len:88 (+) Transcript_25971:1556-1819(+)